MWWLVAAAASAGIQFISGEVEANRQSKRLKEQARLNDLKIKESYRRLKADLTTNRIAGQQALSETTVDFAAVGFDTTSGSSLVALASVEAAVAYEGNSIAQRYNYDISVSKREGSSLRAGSRRLTSTGATFNRFLNTAANVATSYFAAGGKGPGIKKTPLDGRPLRKVPTDKFRGSSLRNPYRSRPGRGFAGSRR